MQAGMMYNLKYVQKALQDRQASRVCDATGISPSTFYRVVNKKGSFSYDTVEALSDYLMDAE